MHHKSLFHQFLVDHSEQIIYLRVALVILLVIACLAPSIFAWARPLRHDRATCKGHLINALAAGTVFVCVLALRAPTWAHYQMNVDEAQAIAGALTLQVDPVFWRSVDGTTVGPLVYYAILLIPAVGAPISYGTVKLFAAVLWSLIVVITGGTLRCFFSWERAFLLIVPFALAVGLTQDGSYIGYNGEHVPAFLLAAATGLMTYGLTRRSSSGVSLAMAGFLLGLVPFAKLQAVPAGIALGACGVVVADSGRRKLGLILGAVIPTVVTVIALFLAGLYTEFIDSYIKDNLRYASQRSELPIYVRWYGIVYMLRTAKLASPFLVCCAAVGATFGMAAMAIEWRSGRRRTAAIVAMYTAYLAGTIHGVAQPGTFFYHYLLFVFHPMFLLCGVGLGLIWDRGAEYRLGTASLATLLLLLMAAGYPLLAGGDRHLTDSAVRHEESVSAASTLIRSLSADHERRLVVWGWATHLYVETGLAQGTREAHTERQILEMQSPGRYVARFCSDLKESGATIFVDATNSEETKYFQDPKFSHENCRPVRDVIESEFAFAGVRNGMRVYVRD